MRPVSFVALDDFDQAGLLQHLEIPAEIAVGQPAKLLQVGEGQSLRVRHQRGQQAKPCLFMDDAVEPRIGERRARHLSLRHRSLRRQNTGSWPSAIGRSQTAGPWSRAKAYDSG